MAQSEHILPGIAAQRRLVSGIYTFVLDIFVWRNKINSFSKAYEDGTGLASNKARDGLIRRMTVPGMSEECRF